MKNAVQRKLSAVFAADVVGYSRLMGLDEVGTRAALRAILDDIVTPSLDAHQGRLVKLMGDGVLAEFASVVDAVNCAVAIQAATEERAAALPEDKRIRLRIGVNIGDIIIEGDDIFGDGVNIAARLEGLADPGGVCVSRTVVDHVGDRSGIAFDDIGEIEVKNIVAKVHAFRVVPLGTVSSARRHQTHRRFAMPVMVLVVLALVIAGVGWWMTRPDFTPADPAAMAAPLPDGPSIAVLPFDYLGADPDNNDYLADGLSENIISTLARIPGTLVIARNSTFTFKNKAVDVREVSEKFGVRYVLEGSVQLSGDAMRVTAQLVDGVDGRHIWTDIYDRTTADIFTVQDDITLNVAKAIYNKTTVGGELILAGGTKNLEAWAEYIKGQNDLVLALPEPVLRSIPRFERAIELDPNFGAAYAGLAHTHFFKARWFLTNDPAASLQSAVELAEKAIRLDPNDVNGYSALGNARLLQRRGDEAAQAVLKGVEIAPGTAYAHTSAAWVLTYAGRADDALPYFEKAKRMHVTPPWWLFGTQFQALSDLGKHREAIASLTKLTTLAPAFSPDGWLSGIAQEHLALGEEDEALRLMAKALELAPNLSIQAVRIWDVPYIDPSKPERRYERMRTLGVPEAPPSQVRD